MDQRICKTCGIHKNITEFPIGKRYKGGYLPHCRSCKGEPVGFDESFDEAVKKVK